MLYRLEVFEGHDLLLYRRHIRAIGDSDAIGQADAFYEVAAASVQLDRFVLSEGRRLVHERAGYHLNGKRQNW